ncbi:MAG: hypothetical protein Q7P63_10335 [Verrucomicrobiota bacterium JB022]|nr:hypothetical protein [Verrucomicrobiota bacterium JB022]
MSFIRNRSNEEWRNAPGMISYVECDAQGEILAGDGQENDELPMITNSFIEIGQAIGQSLGLKGLVDVMVAGPDHRALFVPGNKKNIGVEYLEN